MKNIFLFTSFFFSKLLFSQAAISENFSLTINFEKNIPIKRLEAYYYNKPNNYIYSFEIKTNDFDNSITIKGKNHFIVDVKFPTIYFIYTDNSNQELERKNIFYLVTGEGISSYNENINQIIKFSTEKPNILVSAENVNGKLIYQIENYTSNDIKYSNDLRENLNITNSSIRLK